MKNLKINQSPTMPKIEKQFTLEVTPERFLQSCSREELIELDMLLGSPRFRMKMNPEGMFQDVAPKQKDARQLRIPE